MDLRKMIKDKLPQGSATTQVPGPSKYYLRITWEAMFHAYNAYALLFGTDQSMKRLVERGGFGEQELDAFYPEWRNHIVARGPKIV
jgi:hypothetical protein